MKETIYKEDAINAIVKCTNCNTPEVLREYVAEHSLWSLWSGGVLEALEAVEGLPSAPLYTEDELQTMQDLEWSQMEKMYEFGTAERKKGKWQLCGNHHLCSECDEWALSVWDDNEDDEVDVLTNFCPNCGCDMREGEQDDTD